MSLYIFLCVNYKFINYTSNVAFRFFILFLSNHQAKVGFTILLVVFEGPNSFINNIDVPHKANKMYLKKLQIQYVKTCYKHILFMSFYYFTRVFLGTCTY